MNAWDELAEWVLRRRDATPTALSQQARDELELAIRKDPASFVDTAAEEAMLILARGLDANARSRRDEEIIDDDDAFLDARGKRLSRLVDDCHAALARDPSCHDAALVATLAADDDPATTLEALFELYDAEATLLDGANASWTHLSTRCMLRTKAAIARTCLETAHYRLAANVSQELLTIDAIDHLGTRRTSALALARLEDDGALDALDARFGRHGDAWLHLARSILHFKLDHLAAARRALTGFARLIDGGAYALLRPVMVDTYLPDRPDVAPASYEAATMAVWEAEPIIVDVPDYPFWAAAQPGIADAAETFARRNGFEW